MYSFLFEGTTQYLISLWVMLFSILVCLFILLLTIWVHFRNSRIERRMEERRSVYDNLVKSVRFGMATDTDIKQTLPPADYPYFQNFLNETISTIREIDVSAEKKIAEVSGFMDHLKRRIQKSKKWDRTMAVRVLSYFRDRQNLPLFKKLLAEDSFIQVVFTASMGIALCKDSTDFRAIGQRIWDLTEHNQEAILTILSLHGKTLAPLLHGMLHEEDLEDPAKIVIGKFLGEIYYHPAGATLAAMLSRETSLEVQAVFLFALRFLGNASIMEKVTPFLEHADFNLRIEALHAVAKAAGSNALPYLEKALTDDNWWVRREAALAMATVGKDGIARLKAIRTEAREVPRSAASGILAELRFNRISVEDF